MSGSYLPEDKAQIGLQCVTLLPACCTSVLRYDLQAVKICQQFGVSSDDTHQPTYLGLSKPQ